MLPHHKVLALDLKNATVENFDHWCSTTDYITADATRDFIRYRVKDDENEFQLIFVINDIFFASVTKEEYPNITIHSWFSDEFVQYCIPIQLKDIELYRSVIIDWIFNPSATRPKTANELRQLQKYTDDFDEMMFPHFTSCVTCIDVEELGFNLKEFFVPLNQKFKAIHAEFKKYYSQTKFLKDVKLTKIYILEKYILGYSFRLEYEPYEHFFYNIHFEDLMYQLKPFTFAEVKQLTLDEVLDKINAVGMDQLTVLERKVLTENN
ncbi:hypothetical protein [Flavobacterium sp.]|uniref:hypothetical protein n=1 Tax=Flavobacterium sp. TaxID=239 RepID=UPI00263968F0|nr:hypothetical protein [Flavobacterium sp.]MDD3004556.1 hypothetical protein [Flavobacterium sp.]